MFCYRKMEAFSSSLSGLRTPTILRRNWQRSKDWLVRWNASPTHPSIQELLRNNTSTTIRSWPKMKPPRTLSLPRVILMRSSKKRGWGQDGSKKQSYYSVTLYLQGQQSPLRKFSEASCQTSSMWSKSCYLRTGTMWTSWLEVSLSFYDDYAQNRFFFF